MIGNDASDEVTTKLIDEYCEQDNLFQHIERSCNLGFLRNVNDLFIRADSEIVVLLNSDVIVPAGWAERVAATFDSVTEAALACPLTTNATNLVVKPAPGQSWLDIDRTIAQLHPQYPPCRPVGKRLAATVLMLA
jgi:GT2 family glycosyltransferase